MYQPMFPSLTGNTGQKGAITMGLAKRSLGRKPNSITRKRVKEVPKENVENNVSKIRSIVKIK